MKILVKNPIHFIVSIYFLIAILIRLIWINNIPGINGDEAFYGIIVSQPINWQDRTPTGNVLNIFYIMPLWFIQKIFGSHFWVLRSVSFLSGISLVCLGYFLLQKQWGTHSARLFLFLSAGMPILVAYSRFGWDASQTGLVSFLLLYFSLTRQWAKTVISQIASIIIHPTNIFLIIIPFFLFLQDRYSSHQKYTKKLLFVFILGIGLVFSGIYLFFILQEVLVNWLLIHKASTLAALLLTINPDEILARLVSVPDWKNLLVLYGNLISGVTIYQYLVGSLSEVSILLHSVLFWGIIMPLILYGCWGEFQKKQIQATGIFLSVLVSLILMYLFFGLQPISPHYERYSIFLIVPSLFLLVRGLDMFPNKKISYSLAFFISMMWLGSITLNYFTPFYITGGLSHRTFRTASIEPKEQVVNFILEQTRISNQIVPVVAEDWWLTMPLRYLLIKDKHISVIQQDVSNDSMLFMDSLNQGGFVVSFFQSEFDNIVNESCQRHKCEKKTIFDYGGNPLINIWYYPFIK